MPKCHYDRTRSNARLGAVLWLACAGAFVGAPRLAAAQSDTVDSRVTFVLSDDNVFTGSRNFSPTADIGQRQDIKTFFDNYDTKDSGQETKTDFVLYRRFGGPFPRIETEAGFVARFDLYTDLQTGKPGTRFLDDGTFLQASYRLGDITPELDAEGKPVPTRAGKPPRIYLLAFPFNADRMRLGYSYDITWGGNPIFPKNTTGAPGMKLGWEGTRGYGFVGLKTHRQLNEMTNTLDAVYGLLGGAGYDILDSLRWEVNGGYFQKGVFPPQNSAQPAGVDGKRIEASGASTQVTYHKGIPIETSVDLRLYRNDPNFPLRAFPKQAYSDGWSYLVSSEFSYLVQNLRHYDVYGATKLQPAIAGDVNLRVQRGYLRLTSDFVYRDLAFVLFNVPSFTPYYSFPKNAKVTAEWFVDVGADYYLEDWRLDLGMVLGYQHPSSYTGGVDALADLDGNIPTYTVVVRRQGSFDILPANQNIFDVLAVRGFGRWDMSDGMAAITEVTYTLDKNATRYAVTPDGTFVRQFEKWRVQNRLSIAFILQARF